MLKVFGIFAISTLAGIASSAMDGERLSLADCSQFGQYYNAEDHRDDQRAHFYFKAGADQGSADCQYWLGACYHDGRVAGWSVEQSNDQAFQWYEKAAKQGHVEASFFVGVMSYCPHDGVIRDYIMAHRYFKIAADKGYTEALYYLGLMFFKGQGVDKDRKSAFEYFRLGAKRKHSGSQYYLGKMLYEGEDVPENVEEGLDLIHESIKQKNGDAVAYLGWIQLVGMEYNKALSLYMTAEALGSGEGSYGVGRIYYYGYGVQKDYEEAFQHFQIGAQREDPACQYFLGGMYVEGEAGIQDDSLGFKWLRRAASHKYEKAYVLVGQMYYQGKGISQNYGYARLWLEEAAKIGDYSAMSLLGMIYHEGLGVAVDDRKAFCYFRDAVKGNDVSRRFNLGLMYYNGSGTIVSKYLAFQNFKIAADAGDVQAIWMIANMYEKGEGAKADQSEAFMYYKLLADQGDFFGQLEVAKRYMRGYGVLSDYELGVHYFERTVFDDRGNLKENVQKTWAEALAGDDEKTKEIVYFMRDFLHWRYSIDIEILEPVEKIPDLNYTTDRPIEKRRRKRARKKKEPQSLPFYASDADKNIAWAARFLEHQMNAEGKRERTLPSEKQCLVPPSSKQLDECECCTLF